MKVMVVDDEGLARDRVRRMLDGLEGYECVAEAANGTEALERIVQVRPDVVLLDIRMPGMDGLEAADHIGKLEEPPAVIFCTAYEEHAVEAFNLQAVGYLLKPVRKEQLAQALSNAQRVNRAQLNALSGIDQGRRSHISARTRRGLELIPVEDVLYLQADQKYVTVRHLDGETIVDETLRELEDEFGELFVRVHRSALVSVRHIAGIEKRSDGQAQLLLRGTDERLDISRRHVSQVRKFVRAL
jgi:two-component system response regulator AlgR